MKLNKLFLGAIAALASAAMVACSDDAPDVNNGGENPDGIRYLAVNIVSTPSGGSRAEGPQHPGSNPNNSATYEDGTTTENTVSKVRFYFFTEGGDPKNVKSNQNYNYIDVNPTDDAGEAPNVEKKLKAVLVINTKAGDNLPAKIVAVLNPEKVGLKEEESYNLTNLRNVTADFAKLANDENPVFPMANSVYANEGRTEVFAATKLTLDDFQKKEEDALQKPVKIYVERNVAKIRANAANTLLDENNMIAATDKEGKAIEISGEKVYILVNGWNITNTLPFANLSKHIKIDWNDNDIMGAGFVWNYATYCRSYWAAQTYGVGANGATNTRITYEDFNKLQLGGKVYANENAERLGNSGLEPTSIVMSATLCDAQKNPLTVCEFAGSRVAAKDNNYTALKNIILEYLRNNGSHFWKNGDEGKSKEIEISDITFKTELALNPNATENTYRVYAQLTEDAKKTNWYTDDQLTTSANISAINTALKNLGSAMIYTSGQTYFWKPIQHFNSQGLVRNHIYDLTITGITGLGTPVYDPKEEVIPTDPQTTDSYLAAQIHILTWRVVSQEIEFGK